MIRFRGHFDGKVIVPDEPVKLPTDMPLNINVERTIETEISSSHSQESAPGADTIWQQIANLGKRMPGKLPPDLASQHDHYLHGRPKR